MSVTLGLPPSPEILSGPEPETTGHYGTIDPKYKPYAHQKRAVESAVDGLLGCGFHALFMEMGTGKTKTTLDSWAILARKGFSDALLIIAPKSLVSTWEDEEIPKHLCIPARVLSWDGKATKKSREAFESFFSSPEPIVYIANTEAFQSLNEELRERVSRILRGRKTVLAVDEVSMAKSPDAKRSKNIKAAAALAKGRLILTGTETSKSPLDLFMEFEILKNGFWGVRSFYTFRLSYAILEDAYGPGGRTFKKVVGYQKVGELTSRIAPYTTRALKKDCLDLPEKIRSTIRCSMSDEQAKAYKDLKDHLAMMLESGEVMTVENKISLFTKFRQITGGTVKNGEEAVILTPRPGKLVALLDDVQDTDEQAIIWCAFRAEVDLIANALAETWNVVTFDGSTEIDERNEAKISFQEGRTRFFVANMKTGAYGLNLQNCHIQYIYSRDTSPITNWQAEDRSHRPGQKFPCVYKSLIVPGTVDERIEQLIEQSTDLRSLIQSGALVDVFKYV